MSELDNVISNLKTILEAEIEKTDSPLKDIQKVFYGDPVNILENDLPAIIINYPQFNQQSNLHYTLFIHIAFSQTSYLKDIPENDSIVNAVRQTIIQSEAIREVLKQNPNLAINNDPLTSACSDSVITDIKPSYNSEREVWTYELILTFQCVVIDD